MNSDRMPAALPASFTAELEASWLEASTDTTLRAQLLCERALGLERAQSLTAGLRATCRAAYDAWRAALDLEPRLTAPRTALLRYLEASDLLDNAEHEALAARLAPLCSRDELVALQLAVARRAVERGELAAAEARLRDALELAPSDRQLLDALAELARRAGNHAQRSAIASRQAKATTDPRLAGALALHAAWLHETHLGDPTGAARLARTGLAFQPDDRSLLRLAARVNLAAHQWRAAAQHLEQEAEALADARHDPRLSRVRLEEAARVYARRLSNPVLALRPLERGLEQGGSDDTALLVLAREVALEAGSSAGSNSTWSTARLCEQLAAQAHSGAERARWLWLLADELGEGPQAVAALEAAIAAAPDYLSAALALELASDAPGATAERVGALARRGHAEQAPALLVQAGRIALDSLGDTARAETLYREALALVRSPQALIGPLGALEALQELLRAQGRADDEAALLAWCLEQDLDLEVARRLAIANRQADLLTQHGRTREAIDAWRRVLDLDPYDGHAHARLAALLRGQGRFEELFEVLDTSRALAEVTDPARALPLRWSCAELLARRLGRLDEALELLAPSDGGTQRVPDLISAARLLIEHRRDEALAALYRQQLDSSADAAPRDAARLALGLALVCERGLRDPLAAARAYQLVLQSQPGELAARLGLLRTADAAGLPEAATAALRQLAEHCREPALRAALFFELATRLAAQHGDLEAACEAWASSLEAVPESAIANIAWEACAVRLGQLGAVRERLVRMVELGGDSLDALEWLERALFIAESHDEEHRLLAAILEREPNHVGARLRALLSTFERRDATPDEEARATLALAETLPPGTLQAALLEAAVLLEEHAPGGADRVREGALDDALWRIIELRHDDVTTLVRLLARQHGGEPTRQRIKVVGALARGATRASDQATWLTGLARLLADDGQFERATLALEEVLRLQPSHLGAIRLMRILAEDVGERERLVAAVELEARAVDDPRRAVERLLRAADVRRRQLGDADGAASALEEILRIDPEHEVAFAELQEIYTSQARFETLYDLLRRRAEGVRDPEQRRRVLLRAAELAYDTMRDMPRAIAAHQRLLELEPGFLRSWRVIAEIHLECQQWTQAVEALRAVLGLTSDKRLLGRTWFRLGEVYDQHLGQSERAIEAFRRALEQMPEHLESLYQLADIFERLERLSDTVTCLEALAQLERVPLKRKDVLLRLSRLLLERFGDADRAQEFLVIAREIDPSDLTLTADLAEAFGKRGWRDRRDAFLRASFEEYRDRFEQNVSRPSPLRAMHAIASWQGDLDRAFTLASVLSFVGAANEMQAESYRATLSEAGTRLPRRALPIGKTSGIFAPGLHVSVLHVMRHCDPYLGRFSPSTQRLKGVKRSHRESPTSRRELAALQTIAAAFGITLPDLYVVPDRGESLAFVAGEEPAFVMDPRDLEPVLLPETMARVSIGCAMLAMGLSNFATMDADTFEVALLGACQAVLPERRFGRPEHASAIELVARAVPRRVAEGLAGYVLEIGSELERDKIRAQHQAVLATAMRLGLLTLFDPRPGLTVIARDGDAGHFDVVALMKDALMFLVGDRYAELRQESGIALG